MAASTKSLPTLLAQTSLDDHEEVLTSADAAIKKSKADLEAWHAKAVALLKLDRHEDAVRLFDDAGEALRNRASLEYAYALYKSGRPERALDVAKHHGNSRGMSHVLAQAAYNLENFDQVAAVYGQLISSLSSASDEETDIKINLGAVDAQLEWAGQGHLAQKKKLAREDLEAFETAYNAACGSISRGELAQGEICLKRAKDLLDALTDMSGAEKEEEMLPITVQQVYVLTQLGRVDEAEQLCTTIPFAEMKDLSTRYIAQANSIACSKEHTNPYLSQRLYHASPQLKKTGQHFSFQSHILHQNEYVLGTLCHKYPGVAKSTANLITKSSLPSLDPLVNSTAVLNAAAHAKNATGKAALKKILPLLEKRPTDVGLLMTIAHLYILTNNPTAATNLLETLFKRLEQSGSASDMDVRHAPGLVATLISLYILQSRHAHSKTELAKAATYWRRKSKTPSKALMTAAGRALLESRKEADLISAAEMFQNLHEQEKADRAAIAGLVAAYSITDPKKLSPELVDSLPEVARLVADIDAAALEDAGVPTMASTAAPVQRKRTAEEVLKTSKKIRKSRMPKDFDPNKKMDTERWLPMRDRSYYRPRGKKGKKKMEGLTQGGAVVEEKAQETKPSAGGGGGQNKGKKKKGKGGKW